MAALPKGINDGKGFVFVSHRGEVFPSGFLPISGGNIKKQSLGDIYRNSPLFKDLRDATSWKANVDAASSAKSVAAPAPGPTR